MKCQVLQNQIDVVEHSTKSLKSIIEEAERSLNNGSELRILKGMNMNTWMALSFANLLVGTNTFQQAPTYEFNQQTNSNESQLAQPTVWLAKFKAKQLIEIFLSIINEKHHTISTGKKIT